MPPDSELNEREKVRDEHGEKTDKKTPEGEKGKLENPMLKVLYEPQIVIKKNKRDKNGNLLYDYSANGERKKNPRSDIWSWPFEQDALSI